MLFKVCCSGSNAIVLHYQFLARYVYSVASNSISGNTVSKGLHSYCSQLQDLGNVSVTENTVGSISGCTC